MNEIDLNCPRCKNSFNTMNRIPKMLFMCGHTICNQCLNDLKDSEQVYICIEDNKVGYILSYFCIFDHFLIIRKVQ